MQVPKPKHLKTKIIHKHISPSPLLFQINDVFIQFIKCKKQIYIHACCEVAKPHIFHCKLQWCFHGWKCIQTIRKTSIYRDMHITFRLKMKRIWFYRQEWRKYCVYIMIIRFRNAIFSSAVKFIERIHSLTDQRSKSLLHKDDESSNNNSINKIYVFTKILYFVTLNAF